MSFGRLATFAEYVGLLRSSRVSLPRASATRMAGTWSRVKSPLTLEQVQTTSDIS